MLIRNTLLYMPAQIIGPAAQFAAILVFTHWMAPEPYGLFTYVLVSQDFVFLLCLSWWSQYTVRYIDDQTSGKDETYRRSEAAVVVGTIAMQVVATFLALRIITDQISPGLAGSALLYTITRNLTLHLGERARARSQILDYTLSQSVGPIAGFGLAFAAVAYIAPTPDVALFGYGAAQAAALVWLGLRQDITYTLHVPDGALLRQALAFGLPLIAAGLAVWCGMNAIRILVDHRLGAPVMGLIAVGWGLGNRLTSTVAMLVTVAAYPIAVESLRAGSRVQAFTQITQNGLVMLGLVLPASVGLYLLQAPLVTLLVAEPFRLTTLAILPAALAAGLFRNIRTHVADQVFMLIERTATVCWMAILEGVFATIGCLVGMELGGAVGAAVGSAVGYGLAMVASFAVAGVRAGLRLPWRGTLSIIMATMIMALAIELVPGAAFPGGTITVIFEKIVLGAIVYVGTLSALFPAVPGVAWSRLRRTSVSL